MRKEKIKLVTKSFEKKILKSIKSFIANRKL